jgi:hypothetical protein
MLQEIWKWNQALHKECKTQRRYSSNTFQVIVQSIKAILFYSAFSKQRNREANLHSYGSPALDEMSAWVRSPKEKRCFIGETVSLLNPAANGPIVHPPDDIWMNVEQRWNHTDRGNPKDSQKILSQCHFVHHKTHVDYPENEPGLSLWEAGD